MGVDGKQKSSTEAVEYDAGLLLKDTPLYSPASDFVHRPPTFTSELRLVRHLIEEAGTSALEQLAHVRQTKSHQGQTHSSTWLVPK